MSDPLQAPGDQELPEMFRFAQHDTGLHAGF
jgi:hypothetical protein